MKYSEAEIEAFLTLGEPKEEKFLKWLGRESFFDAEVQTVLDKIHPTKNQYPDNVLKCGPVKAWTAADCFARSRSIENWIDLYEFSEQAPIWTADLISALVNYYKWSLEQRKQWDEFRGGAKESCVDTIAAVQFWRDERYLWETSRFAVSHEKAVKLKASIRRTEKAVAKLPKAERDLLGAAPIDPEEQLDGPAKWFEGTLHPWSNPQTRTSICRENARRDQIMRKWAECWLDYFHQPTVTGTPPKL